MALQVREAGRTSSLVALVLVLGATTVTGLVESNTKPLNHFDPVKYKGED